MGLESIHNYYEKRIISMVRSRFSRVVDNEEQLADIACVALNHLPPRYICHEVDMAFYMSTNERLRMEQDIENAVAFAAEYILKRKVIDAEQVEDSPEADTE